MIGAVERLTGGDLFVFFGVVVSSLAMIPASHLIADIWHRIRRK